MQEIIFEKIKLWNFRSHEYMEFDFEPNRFCVLCGGNGKGKSSIFDALFWVLYDVTTNKKRKADSVIRKRSGKNCHVNLTFRINEDRYEVDNYRKHQKYKNDKTLKKNTEDISGATRSETNAKISQLLMPPQIFINCLMFSQYIDTSFNEMPDSEKKDILDVMLNLIEFDEKKKLFAARLTVLENEIRTIEMKMDGLNSVINENNISLEKEERNKKEYLSRYEEKISEYKKDLIDIEKAIVDLQYNMNSASLNDVLAGYIKIETVLTSQQQQLIQEKRTKEDAINNQIKNESWQEINKIKAKYSDALNNLNLKRGEVLNYLDVGRSKINTTEQEAKNEYILKLRSVEKEENEKLKPLQTERNSIVLQSSHRKETLSKILDEVNNLSAQISARTEQLRLNKCYACGQDIKDESYNKIEIEIDKKKTEKDSLYSQVSGINIELEELTAKLITIDVDLQLIIDVVKSQKDEIDNWKKNKKEELDNSRRELDKKCKEEITVIENYMRTNQKELDDEVSLITDVFANKLNRSIEKLNNEYNGKIKEMDPQILDIQNKISKCKNDIETQNQQKTQINNLLINKNVTSANIESARNQLKSRTIEFDDNIKNLVLRINEKKLEFVKMQISINEINDEFEIVRFWRNAYSDSGIKGIILDESLPTLNKKAKELSGLTDCLRVQFDSQSPTGAGELRNKFTITAIQTKNLTDEVVDFSGGETRLVDVITLLCLRHLLEAIHQVKINIMLFDETLDALDPDNVEVLLKMLKTLSVDHMVTLITHTLRDNIEADQTLEL